jgi:hypothetical protein
MEKYLLRGAKDPNEMVILFEAKDLKRAENFAGSADLRETIEKLGVVDKPNTHSLNG